MGAVNQQERLSETETKKWFLAGFIEGEGSLCVSMKEHPTAKFGYYVDPEFFLYQHKSGIEILDLAKEIFGSGRIVPKCGNEDVLVFSITSRRTLIEKIIPFYEKYMVYSYKKSIFNIFKDIVEAMDRKEHWTPEGMAHIVRKAYMMNPASKGKERKRTLDEVLDRILRDYKPDSDKISEKI